MKLFSHASTVFPVDDPEKTANFYEKKLGFSINFKWDDPATYVVLNRDDAVGIHLVKKEGSFSPPANHNTLYIFVHDIDALYDEYKRTGAPITNPIENRDYGMRDFDVTDPDGFILSFGQAIKDE